MTLSYYKKINTVCIQSIPILGFLVFNWLALHSATDFIGLSPQLSAKHVGSYSKASAKALTAYYSMVGILSAYSLIEREQAISEAPPPQTILGVLIRFLTTHMASWTDLFASSTTILLPPLIKTVTAFEHLQSSIMSIFSFPVPN